MVDTVQDAMARQAVDRSYISMSGLLCLISSNGYLDNNSILSSVCEMHANHTGKGQRRGQTAIYDLLPQC